MKNLNQKIALLANWINENIVGSVWAFVICVLFVAIIYISLFIQGYNKWNTSIGLFSNTLESSFELITGVGAVVGVVALHKSHKAHKKDISALHAKVDALHKRLGVKSDE